MADEIIGGVSVSITGDFTSLQSDIDKATQIAAEGGQDIAKAMNQGAAGADALSKSLDDAGASAKSFEAQIQEAIDGGATLAEALEQVKVAGDGVGAKAEESAEGIKKLGDEAGKAGKEVKDNLEPGLKKGSDALGEFAKMGKAFAGLAIVTTIAELGMAALEAADALDDASYAMEKLGGSAEEVAATVDQLRNIANDSALSFPELLTAGTRMTAFLGSTEQVPALLQAAADSAAIMGNSIETASGSLQRIVASGDLSQRSLQKLGLTMEDVAAVMGMSKDKIKDAFEGMDPSARVEVMVAALNKFKGAAKDMSNDSIGAFQRLKNQFQETLSVIGTAIEPAVHAIVTVVNALMFSLEKQAVAIMAAFKAAAEGAKALYFALKFDFVGYTAGIEAMRAAWQKGETDLKNLDDKHTKVNTTVAEGTRLSGDQIKALAQEGLARHNAAEAAKKQDDILKALNQTAKELGASLPKTFEDYAAAVEMGGQTASSALTAISTAIRKANIDMESMKGKPLAAMQAVVDKLEVLRTRAKEFADQDIFNKAAVQIAGFASKYEAELGKLDAATLNWVNNSLAAARSLENAFGPLEQAKFLQEWLAGMQKLSAESEKLDADFKKMAMSAKGSMEGYKNGVLQVIPLTVELRTRLGQTVAAYLDMVEAMNKVGLKTVQQMQSEIATNKDLLASMTARNQAIGLRMELNERILEQEIRKADIEGKASTASQIALTNQRLQQQALIEQLHLWGDLYEDVINSLVKGWMSVAGAIGDAIFEGKNFGDSMMHILKTVAKEITESLIKVALKTLKNEFIGVGKTVQDATKDMEKFTKAVMDAAGVAQKSEGAGAAGKFGKAGAGGTMGTIGAISALATAISSIFGNFQMAAMNKSLDVLVNHTLRTFNVLDQWYTASQDWFNQEFTRLGEIWRDMNLGFQMVTDAITTGSGGGNYPLPLQVPPLGPSIPGLPQTSALTAATYNTKSTLNNLSSGPMTINVYEASDARETARQVAGSLKQISPRFASYGR